MARLALTEPAAQRIANETAGSAALVKEEAGDGDWSFQVRKEVAVAREPTVSRRAPTAGVEVTGSRLAARGRALHRPTAPGVTRGDDETFDPCILVIRDHSPETCAAALHRTSVVLRRYDARVASALIGGASPEPCHADDHQVIGLTAVGLADRNRVPSASRIRAPPGPRAGSRVTGVAPWLPPIPTARPIARHPAERRWCAQQTHTST